MRLGGRIGLWAERTLGPTHAVDGDKILPIVAGAGAPIGVRLHWRYRMGAGLCALELELRADRGAPRRLTVE